MCTTLGLAGEAGEERLMPGLAPPGDRHAETGKVQLRFQIPGKHNT